MAQADYLRPFELLERVLIRHGGRRRLVARLGLEAEDGIDALLDQALAYESVEAPSLTGFLGWIDRDDVHVKRRTDDSADQVRVMTVHGAKGLESPIVILPDTGDRHEGANPPNVLRLADGQAIWKGRKEAAPAAEEAAEAARRELVREEQRRLLYVALTRAETWLIVCGAGSAPRDGGESWYRLVSDAMEGLRPERHAGPQGEIMVLSENWRPGTSLGEETRSDALSNLPDWARRPAAPRPDAGPRAISPSGLGGGHALAGDGGAESEAEAKARGDAVHLLLEVFAMRRQHQWPSVAARLLPDRDDRDDLVGEAARVVTSPELAGIFDAATLAEVDVSATIAAPGGVRVFGRIDRLVVEDGRVMAVDFKSNRTVPERPEDVPEGILRQMGAYRAALGAIWPERRIEVAVVWTRTARLMPLPDALVDAALARSADLDPVGGRP
jgi:ATP-dependent helicase/nuclease subunit A